MDTKLHIPWKFCHRLYNFVICSLQKHQMDISRVKSKNESESYSKLVNKVENEIQSSRNKKRKRNCRKRKISETDESGSTNNEDKNYFCVTCKNQFGAKDLAYHTNEKCKPKPNRKEIDCRICFKTINNRDSYEIHWDKYHHDVHRKEMFENGIRCRMCPRYLKNWYGYLRHLKFSHKNQIDKLGLSSEALSNNLCTKCGFLASDKSMMKEHMESSHAQAQKSPENKKIVEKPNPHYKFTFKRTKCRLCRKSFACVYNYEQHWLISHKSVHRKEMFENGINCCFCDRWFSSISGYSVHLGCKHIRQIREVASNVNEFCKNMCQKCGHRGVDKISLQKHIDESHQSAETQQKTQKIFKCHLCPSSYHRLVRYEVHWKRCHATVPAHEMYDNPITCYFCKTYFLAAFSYKCHLKEAHPNQLESIGLFQKKHAHCYICRKCGIFTENLKKHTINVHQISLSSNGTVPSIEEPDLLTREINAANKIESYIGNAEVLKLDQIKTEDLSIDS